MSDAQAADNQQKLADRSQVLQTRAAEDSLDDLIPAATKPSANPVGAPEAKNPANATNATNVSGASVASVVSGDAALNVPAKVDSTAAVPAPQEEAAEANPAVQNTQNDAPVKELTNKDAALQDLPALPDPLVSTPSRKPLTLEEEAAAAGLIRPESNENLPNLSAQALLSGQPLAPDEDEDLVQQLPIEKKKKSQSYRDTPLRPVIQPLRHGFNYRRTTLPPSIYRKQFSGDNQYLPLATYREDYDRALFYAVAANDINGTRAFLERGADINMVNVDGDTLLITAVRYRAFDTARLLLARGANPTIQGSGGVTAIQYAIASQQSELATILRARGA